MGNSVASWKQQKLYENVYMSRKLALQLSISLCDCFLRIDVHVCVRVCNIRVILSSTDSMTLPIKYGVILARSTLATIAIF